MRFLHHGLARLLPPLLATALLAGAQAARAELTIGVILPLTGPASGLGIPMNNGVKLWPASIGGENVRVVVLDDGTDPAKGVRNARRFVTEEKADVLVGSGATPVAVAIAEVAADAETVQLALSPIPLPPGRDAWSFRVPHNSGVMAAAMVRHMKTAGVKTVGFIGYSDAYGESWLGPLRPQLEKAGIKLTVVERFARTDTSVTSQALKITAGRPDAVVVVASGSGAAMPQLALVDRGYSGLVYQTHGAATRDLIRVGGKGVERTLVSTPSVMVAEQLPASDPRRMVGMSFAEMYEKAYGAGSRNALAAHGYDVFLILDKAVPIAKQRAKPGTPEFRAALRDALESMAAVALTGGMIDYTATDHWGYAPDGAEIMQIVNGDWKLIR